MCASNNATKVHPALGSLLNVRNHLRNAVKHSRKTKLFGMLAASKKALIQIGMTAAEIKRMDDIDDDWHAKGCTKCQTKDAVLANAA